MVPVALYLGVCCQDLPWSKGPCLDESREVHEMAQLLHVEIGIKRRHCIVPAERIFLQIGLFLAAPFP